MEFTCVSWTLLFSAMLAGAHTNESTYYMLSLFCVTLPTMILRKMMFYSFACPCLIRRHDRTCLRACIFPIFESCGSCVGIWTFLGGVACLIVFYIRVRVRVEGESFASAFIFSWWMGYILSIVQEAVTTFCPFNIARGTVSTLSLSFT